MWKILDLRHALRAAAMSLFVYDGGPGLVTLVFAVVGEMVCLIQGGSRSLAMISTAGARVA